MGWERWCPPCEKQSNKSSERGDLEQKFWLRSKRGATAYCSIIYKLFFHPPQLVGAYVTRCVTALCCVVGILFFLLPTVSKALTTSELLSQVFLIYIYHFFFFVFFVAAALIYSIRVLLLQEVDGMTRGGLNINQPLLPSLNRREMSYKLTRAGRQHEQCVSLVSSAAAAAAVFHALSADWRDRFSLFFFKYCPQRRRRWWRRAFRLFCPPNAIGLHTANVCWCVYWIALSHFSAYVTAPVKTRDENPFLLLVHHLNKCRVSSPYLVVVQIALLLLPLHPICKMKRKNKSRGEKI